MKAEDWKKFTELMEEAKAALAVARDVGTGATKTDAEQISQELLAFATVVLEEAKNVAIPHKIELFYHGATLRYPEDSEAGYQMDPGDQDYALYKSYSDRATPKFLGDGIWNSSENCNEQGLNIFSSYVDFAMHRGDYTWEDAKARLAVAPDDKG